LRKIREYNSDTDTWSIREFESNADFANFVSKQYKMPGQYNLKNTEHYYKARTHYIKHGYYCPEVVNSKKYFSFWTEEAIKCIKGVIIDGIYISGYYYFYLNYCPIIDMVKKSQSFAEVWDSDLHFFLYVELCLIKGKHALVNKKRRWGLSFKVTSMIMRDTYLLNNQTAKIITKQEPPLKTTWEFLDGYKAFLNEHTGWSRSFASDKFKLLDFRLKIKVGNKQVERGRKNVIKGIVTANSPSSGVGGLSTVVFFEEAGVNSTLDKSFEFIKPTLQIGGLTTGIIVVAGSVGELKECEPLRKFTYNPDDNDFLGVPDLVNPEKSVSFFVPTFWNYIHEIKDNEDNVIGHERCYDNDGNSNIERAKQLILETGLLQARKDPASYALFKSQYPETLEDLYGARETNIFPIAILSKQSFNLDDYKPVTIDIIEDAEGKLKHTLISKPIVTDFPLKSQSYREGAICMVEPPMDNPPNFLYFAGVDPVKSLQGIGESLMSVHIFQNFYVENNELKGGKLVAWYTGRNEDTHVTFRKIKDLLNYYNAAAVVESDQSSFIDWMIAEKQNYRHRLLKRSQVPILKDLVPNSAIGDEYGVRMNTGGTSSRVKDYMHTKIIDYVSDVLSERYLEDGTKIPIYGVERIKDQMLIKEMLNFNAKGNYDRIVSFGLALLTAAVYESRQVIHKKTSFSEPVVTSSNMNVPMFKSSNYKINVLTTSYKTFR